MNTSAGLIDFAALENGGRLIPDKTGNTLLIAMREPVIIESIRIDTDRLPRGPKRCRVEGCYQPEREAERLDSGDINWSELVPESALNPEDETVLENRLYPNPLTHVRLHFDAPGEAKLSVYGHEAYGMW